MLIFTTMKHLIYTFLLCSLLGSLPAFSQNSWLNTDINVNGASDPTNTFVVGGGGSPERLVFIAKDDQGDYNLYAKQAPNAAPQLVSRGFANSFPYYDQGRVVNGLLYIINSTTNSLWRSDGTVAGTYELAQGLNINTFSLASSLESWALVPGGGFYFRTNDSQLAYTNGLQGITNTFKISSTNYSFLGSDEIMYHEGKIYFSAYSNTSGYEPWVYDPSTGVSTLIKNINANSSSNPHSFFSHNGIVCFIADDGRNGDEIWYTNGTPGGTDLLLNLNPNGDGIYNSSYGLTFQEIDENTAVFSGQNANTTSPCLHIWTDSLYYYSSYTYPNSFVRLGDRIIFKFSGGIGSVALDGSSAVTLSTRYAYDDFNSNYAVLNGKLYFEGYSTTGLQLSVTDGLQSVVALPIQSSAGRYTYAKSIRAVGGSILYFADDGTNGGYELWQYIPGPTIGTSTHIKRKPSNGPNSQPVEPRYTDIEPFQGSAFFTANYNSDDNELWGFANPLTSVQLQDVEKVGLFPNPAKDKIQLRGIEAGSIVSAQACTVDGRWIDLKADADNSFTTDGLAPGVYQMIVTRKGGIISKLRFTKE